MLSDIEVVVDDSPGALASAAEVVAGSAVNLDGIALTTFNGKAKRSTSKTKEQV